MMLTLRIRKAEVALADGRLDDAYQQAIREDVREHRRGQRLINRLAKAFQKRGQEHLDAGNAQGALADIERATRLGGNQPKIVALRDDALAKLANQQTRQRQRQQKVAAVRQCIASGDFSLGAKLGQPLDSSSDTVAGLIQDAEVARQRVDVALDRARQAMKGQDWEQALTSAAEAKRLQPSHATVNDLVGQVTQSVTRQIRAFLKEGRLDQGDALLRRLREHLGGSLDAEELARVISKCREAGQAMRSVEMATAMENLKSLKHVLPDARWLDGVIKDVEVAARSMESLRTGPLGLLRFNGSDSIQRTVASTKRKDVSPLPTRQSSAGVPENFLIHVDGGGSFLIVRSRYVTVGTQSRSRPVNVPLMGPMGLPRLTIERTDEDYFLSGEEAVEVNGKRTASTLLANQDRIQLGRRGSIEFLRPCAASTSAVLDFRGVRLAHGNHRRVILMDDALVLGPQPAAHVHVPQLQRAMVLYTRNGELRMRPMSRVGENAGVPVEMGRPQDLDGLSLVVTEVVGVA